MYRIRTADKGRPIIISNRIIEEYADPIVDTLHKKNLLSLGEDRFLTTLLLKHFPTFRTKFTPNAVARTIAPESWRVLFSQRRRWINSTVHNLCELVFLPELVGFCCFSMRFFVFIDLLGTLVGYERLSCIQCVLTASQILPATTVYVRTRLWSLAITSSTFFSVNLLDYRCLDRQSRTANHFHRHDSGSIWSTGTLSSGMTLEYGLEVNVSRRSSSLSNASSC